MALCLSISVSLIQITDWWLSEIAERGVGWWRVDEIGEEGTESQL